MRSLTGLVALILFAQMPILANAQRVKPTVKTPVVEILTPKAGAGKPNSANRIAEGTKLSLGEFKLGITELGEKASLSEESAIRINDFSQRLMTGILEKTKPGKNVFITGPAMAGAVAMLINGASEQGQKELLTTLGYGAGELEQLNSDISALMAKMNSKSNSIETSMSNAFFADVGLPIRPEYSAVIEQEFGGISKQVEFENNPKAATETVNTWASDATQGMVKEIIDEATAAELASLLATAVYFKGNWETKFDENNTYPDTFIANGDFLVVPTMHGTMDVKGIINFENDYVVAQLPYEGGSASMYVIMGRDGQAPADVLAQAMAAKDIEKFANGSQEVVSIKDSEVQLPKFKVKYSNAELKEVFEAMGVEAVFNAGNLTGMSPDERLKVVYIKMDTALEVDEQGSKAGGVASIGSGLESAGPSSPFVFNRPFAIVIRDERTGVNLFTGVINNPSAAE